jgi:transcriptional regulator with XRE-family HTH domain
MKNSGKYQNNLNLIGKTLRKIRTEQNMSLESLSSKLLLLDVNIPVTCLHRIENNQRTVRDYEICALAIVLDVSLNDLLGSSINEIKNNKF